MKEIRFFVYVLLCSLSLVHVYIANDKQKQVVLQPKPECPTSPVSMNYDGTSSIIGQENIDHRTTPVDLAASLRGFPSCPSCASLLEKASSNTFASTSDLVALAVAHNIHSPSSPTKRALLDVPVNTAFHGTTPVK